MSARRRSGGFTLIEIVAVIVLMAIAVLGILAVFGDASRTLGLNVASQTGSQLAQQMAEQILADRRNPARGYAYIIPANYPVGPVPVPGSPNYTRTITITNNITTNPPCPVTTAGTCSQVVVTISSGGQVASSATFMVANY